MSTITQDMVEAIESAKLMFVATVRPDGTPNLSPKGSVRVLDPEHLIFADIASPQTVTNLRTNPAIEVNAVDFIARKGFRFRGTAEILEPGGEEFEWIARWLRETHADLTPCDHTVKVRVTEVRELLSPAYTVEHIPEAEVRRVWLGKYGLTPVAEQAIP
ncbi:MAG: hypothetical protein ABS81_05615 [Pseudonocardia sp. SCN 72-86]|nr:MAG: hypothetical protein ABS81_05615 [Pseudonocardia sp. SCN 72-86]